MKIFCSGIGGIGLSAYAALQKAAGHEVAGSDRTDSDLLHDLSTQGITISLNQDGSALDDDIDLYVFSEAIPKDAPERVKAQSLGIEMLSYFQALGQLAKGHLTIAVCGTHGKSSTVGMASQLLMDAGLDPSIVVGTKLPLLDGRNWRKGKGEIFLVEACEYRKSFHFIQPSVVLMTNVDGDHFDAFSSLDDYHTAFVDFLKMIPSYGKVIAHMNDAESNQVVQKSGKPVLDADKFALPELSIPGLHMRQNAQLVLGLAEYLALNTPLAESALKAYRGSWRRMEVKGEIEPGVTVIDDYGHHPKEIRATLQAMKEGYPTSRLVVVYQPHMHDRTLKLYDEFLPSFSGVDLLMIPNIYDARSDVERDHVDVEKFAKDISEGSKIKTLFTKNFDETEKMLKQVLQKGDVLVFMGAGDITDLATKFYSEGSR